MKRDACDMAVAGCGTAAAAAARQAGASVMVLERASEHERGGAPAREEAFR